MARPKSGTRPYRFNTDEPQIGPVLKVENRHKKLQDRDRSGFGNMILIENCDWI